ncbi:histone-lysine N-methyltransferase SETMAR [Trichonephila clavipes]|nr:histone-lysine N-methyltransferase SETMAR [Trichonephila clavipes]
MGIPYHPGIKATVDGMATHILYRQDQSQTNAVKAQNYGNSVLTQGLTSLTSSREFIESFGWEVLDHAPYSPCLAPSDFRHFRYLKHSLGGKCFSYNEEVKAALNSWLSDQAADYFEEGFQHLVLRYDKCINKLGNYVEK